MFQMSKKKTPIQLLNTPTLTETEKNGKHPIFLSKKRRRNLPQTPCGWLLEMSLSPSPDNVGVATSGKGTLNRAKRQRQN